MIKKLSIEHVQEKYKELGLDLLDSVYFGAHTPMKYRCDAGHVGKMRWANVQQGHGCVKCARGKKKTLIQEVQEGFRRQGLTLLETEYVDSKTPMQYRCKAGHEGRMMWGNVRSGAGCAQCAGVAKPTLQEVQKGFRGKGLTLLEEVYIDNKTPMRYRCCAGHEGRMRWSTVKGGSGCVQCGGRARLALQEVQEGFRRRGFTLLDTEYVNKSTPMRFRCATGHEGKITWSSVQGGHGCAKCAGKNITIQEAQEKFREQMLTLLETEYVNSSTPMRYSCEAGHEGRTKWVNIQQGRGCAQCARNAKLTFEEVQDGFSRRGLTLLETEYLNSATPMRYNCNNGHEGKIRWSSVQVGQGCAQCAENGFNPCKPAKLYYVKIFPKDHPPVYKIGITNTTIRKRFWDVTKSYQLIQTWSYEVGQDAYDREQELLKKYSSQRIPAEIGRKLVKGGYTELFYSDVLGLDLHKKKPSKRSQPQASVGLEQLVLWGG
jgi:hypothetical protein